MPVSDSSCAPCPASPVTSYVADWLPLTVGAKVTVWRTLCSGPMTKPSASWSALLNTPAGAFALVTVTGMFPVLVMVKLRVLDVPRTTAPNERLVGLNTRWPSPLIASPSTGMVSAPLVLLSVIDEEFWPVTVGAYPTCRTMELWAGITVGFAGSALGRSAAVNGPSGGVTEVMVSGSVPVFVNWTFAVAVVPVGWLPKDTVPGNAARPDLVPTPCRLSAKLPASVATVSVPLAPRTAAGVKETGIDSCPPAGIVGGSDDVSAVNGPSTVTPLTPRECDGLWFSVRTTSVLAEPPTGTSPNSTGLPLSGLPTGLPKA